MSTYAVEANFLRTVKIEKAVKESPLVKTFFFDDRLCVQCKPGQFIMVWLPGFDEVPMSVSSGRSNGFASITVATVGEATRLLHEKKKGDLVGIRGPFGNSFNPVRGHVLLVGGGTGIVPLAFLAEKLVELKAHMTFVLGARTREELILLSKIKDLFSKSQDRIVASTEDGSYGHKGVVTELAEEILTREKFDMIYVCGKEQMLLKIFMLAENYGTLLQASLERLMRCAVGLCGSCAFGKYRVCVDGPVFTEEQLREVKGEFGCFKRDLCGRKTPV